MTTISICLFLLITIVKSLMNVIHSFFSIIMKEFLFRKVFIGPMFSIILIIGLMIKIPVLNHSHGRY